MSKRLNSRAKGARREREFASYLRDSGFAAKRGQQFAGGLDSPDVVGLPGWHVEVKGTEKVHLRDWVAQASGDAGDGKRVVAHKWNGGPWLAVLRMDDFIDMVRALMEPQTDGQLGTNNYEEKLKWIRAIIDEVGGPGSYSSNKIDTQKADPNSTGYSIDNFADTFTACTAATCTCGICRACGGG